MSIEISQGNSTLSTEYVVTSITFNYNMVLINGVLTPQYTSQVAYHKQVYVLDSNGNKIGTVSNNAQDSVSPPPDLYGSVYLSGQDFQTLLSLNNIFNTSFNTINLNADTMMQTDLTARKIIGSTGATGATGVSA